ncbi:MAG: serine/threonine protein kinase [Sandaracinaceae bacterium]|nr:serine/threonine protein kinase [Sandaracinaceae bacterium]
MAGGQYVPLQRLNAGATEVWYARLEGAEGFRRPIVLKVARTPDARRDLVREASIGAALAHPLIAQVFELFELDGALALALEHVPGLSLRALLDELARTEGRMPWPIAACIVADTARALAHAHEACDARGVSLGLVHRDVGPANLLAGETGFTKVLDFGIAQSALAEHTAHVVRGTPGYLSPEQAAGWPVDWRSDVFSLGAVLYELVAGHALISGASDAAFAQLAQHGVPPLDESIDPTVRTLVKRMLAVRPEQRMLPMAEVADALEASAVGRGGGHRDVQSFLQSEAGPLLARRRKRLSEWALGRHEPHAILRGAAPAREASTLTLLESALDSSDPHPLFDDQSVETHVELTEDEATELDSGRRR